ncbi:hypothetical protein [Parabacteroides sp.]
MRKNIIIFICICLNMLLYAESGKMPHAISYQAVVHDATGKVLANKTIGVKVEILKTTAEGSCIYSETHSSVSNANGTITLLIGQGTPISGNFSAIDWGADTYYLQLSMDTQGGTAYNKISSAPISPVPLSLYAEKAGFAEKAETNHTKYVIIPMEYDTDMYNIFAGEDIIHDYDELLLNYFIAYLDGNDQQISSEVEGLPDGIVIDNEDLEGAGESTSSGRFFQWNFLNFKDGSYNLKLIFKDKNGGILKEYPFKLIINKDLN